MAIEVLTKYLAKELGSRGISVNVLAPGAIETDFGGGRGRDDKEINAFNASQTSLDRVGPPDDIGDVIAALVSGGQSGVDRAGLDAAIKAGIPIGGYCPKGRHAEDGTIPGRYPMIETAEPESRFRTEKNVIESDGTLTLNKGESDPFRNESLSFLQILAYVVSASHVL